MALVSGAAVRVCVLAAVGAVGYSASNRRLVPVTHADTGVENRDNGIHTASVAARYAGKRPTLSGFAARTANSRHSDAPVRQCWISTAFGLMTNTLRARQRQSQRLRLPPRTLRLG